jgi:hypothetical protein
LPETLHLRVDPRYGAVGHVSRHRLSPSALLGDKNRSEQLTRFVMFAFRSRRRCLGATAAENVARHYGALSYKPRLLSEATGPPFRRTFILFRPGAGSAWSQEPSRRHVLLRFYGDWGLLRSTAIL